MKSVCVAVVGSRHIQYAGFVNRTCFRNLDLRVLIKES